MKTSYKIAIVAIPLAIATFVLGRIIWPEMPGMPGPSSSLVPHFMLIGALESISFGIGIAFLLFGWRYARSAKTKFGNMAIATFLSIAWMLISWWPHDNMHRVNGMDNFSGLLRIEYIFHLTLVLAGFIVACFFWRIAKST